MRSFLARVSTVALFLALFSVTDALAAPGTLITSGVTYNPDSSANISRPTDSVRVPEHVTNPTQAWVAVRMKMGFPSTTPLSPDPIIWDMSEANNSSLFLYYDVATDRFHFGRVGVGVYSPTQSFSVGTTKTFVARWTANGVGLSLDGAPFTVNANSGPIPAQSSFLIGSSLVQGSGRQPNSDYYWVAAGTGTLTDADATAIHHFGNTDHPRSDFPGAATFVWWADSDAYNTDSVGPTVSPTPSRTLTPSRTPTPGGPSPTRTPTPGPCSSTLSSQGDANCDCTVSGADYAIWLAHYQQSTGNGFRDGDFNGDGTVSGVDYAIWLAHYRQTCSGPTPTPPIGATNTPTPGGPTATRTPTPAGPTPSPTGGIGRAPYNFGPWEQATQNGTLSLIELQGWWAPITPDGLRSNGDGFGHLHILCKWPAGQNIRNAFPDGVIRTDCRLTMHDNPSQMQVLRFDLAPGDIVHSISLSGLPPGSPQSGQARCFYNNGLGSGSTNCSWNVPVTLNTNGWYNGWNHVRVRFTVQTADGKRWTTSSEIPMQNGIGSGFRDGGFSSCSTDCFIAKSWYEGFEYQRVRLVNVPLTRKISGTHTFYAQAWKGNSPRTQRLLAVVDRSHVIPAVGPWPVENAVNGSPPGSVNPDILDVANPDIGRLYPIVVDTTKMANGWHSIAARTIEANPGRSTCDYCTGADNFQVGVAKMFFYVEN